MLSSKKVTHFVGERATACAGPGQNGRWVEGIGLIPTTIRHAGKRPGDTTDAGPVVGDIATDEVGAAVVTKVDHDVFKTTTVEITAVLEVFKVSFGVATADVKTERSVLIVANTRLDTDAANSETHFRVVETAVHEGEVERGRCEDHIDGSGCRKRVTGVADEDVDDHVEGWVRDAGVVVAVDFVGANGFVDQVGGPNLDKRLRTAVLVDAAHEEGCAFRRGRIREDLICRVIGVDVTLAGTTTGKHAGRSRKEIVFIV